jgi:hypothetical protein
MFMIFKWQSKPDIGRLLTRLVFLQNSLYFPLILSVLFFVVSADCCLLAN